MGYYKRRLPHWDPEGKALFVTWRLYGSLPADVRSRVATGLPARRSVTGQEPRRSVTGQEFRRSVTGQEFRRSVTGQEPRHYTEPVFPSPDFLKTDRWLDRARAGPLWLKNDDVAKCVADTLLFGECELKLYELHSYVVMPNHVHVLFWPNCDLVIITKRIKSFSAKECNGILARTGKRFWQEESFDHWIRTTAEYTRVAEYIEWNPVSAGLVKRPEDWKWSSAAK